MEHESDINQRELLEKVLSDDINWKDALKVIQRTRKPWHTREWKERRKLLLASRCQNCGTTTPPLVLQHTWHPTPLHHLFYNARKKYQNEWLLWKQSHALEIDMSSLNPDADGCPKCGSTTIRYRKRAMTWICVSKPAGITCGNIFEAPIRVISYKAIRKIEEVASQEIRDDFDEEFGIGKKVVILAIEQHLRYVSLKDTKTLCKRCAFVEDKTKMVLCNICRKNYHSRKYDRCSICAGFDTTESREMYKSLKEIHQSVPAKSE
jgi:ssDNA-binding Zn-finger/Zn-ribbon topoisomerase 1